MMTSRENDLLGSLLSGVATFDRGVVTFGEQKTLCKVGATKLFLRNKRRQFI